VLDLGCVRCPVVDAGISMSQTMPINADLVDSLAQVILSLNDQERQLLLDQVQDPNPGDRETLREKIAIAEQQRLAGEYTDYTDETLPDLFAAMRSRVQSCLNQVCV
jgi:hypothetical protein